MPQKHTRTICKSDTGFLQQPVFTLALNSDCSRALLSAPGKRNYCIPGNERGVATHTLHRTVVQPSETQTRLSCKVQGEDGSFCIYNDHNKKTLFSTSTAEFRDNFPLTTHIAMVSVSFHSSPQVVDAVLSSSLSSFKCKKSATMNSEKQLYKENCHFLAQ